MHKRIFDVYLEDILTKEKVSLRQLGMEGCDASYFGNNAEVWLLQLIINQHKRINDLEDDVEDLKKRVKDLDERLQG